MNNLMNMLEPDWDMANQQHLEPEPSLHPTSESFVACASCYEEFPPISLVPVINDQYCEECFKSGYVSQFHRALKDESRYPVKYQSADLKLSDYERFFTQEFREAWNAKVKEYETPIKSRIYCKNKIDTPIGDYDHNGAPITHKQECGIFLARKPEPSTLPEVHCPSCTGSTCTQCSTPILKNQTHECQESSDETAFSGLERGVDYQICPNPTCQIKAALQDGCNHVQCPMCWTEFCFHCGETILSPSAHWKNCPQYGKNIWARDLLNDDDESEYVQELAEAQYFLELLQTPAPAPPPRLEPQEQQPRPSNPRVEMAQTIEGRLMRSDRRTLASLRDRVLAVPEPRDPIVNAVYALILELESGIAMYTAHLRPEEERTDRVAENSRIRRLVDGIGMVGFRDWLTLRMIVDAYEAAWEGRVADLRRMVR